MAKITYAQVEMKETHIKEDENRLEKCIEQIVAWKALAVESWNNFGCRRDETVSQDTLRTVKRGSAIARYYETLAVLQPYCECEGRKEG